MVELKRCSLKHICSLFEFKAHLARALLSLKTIENSTSVTTHFQKLAAENQKISEKWNISTVKHGTQNIQNDCHQWLSDSFRVHQIRVRPGLGPGPHRGAYSASQTLYVALLLRGRGGEGKGVRQGREKGERKGAGGTAPPPFANFWIRP